MVFEKPTDAKAVTKEIVKRINDDARRIRSLEISIDRIGNSVGNLEETLLIQMDDLKINLERISQKIAGVTERLSAMENEILRINKLLDKAATKTEVKQLENFIDLVNPITSKFVTRDELDRVLEEKIKG